MIDEPEHDVEEDGDCTTNLALNSKNIVQVIQLGTVRHSATQSSTHRAPYLPCLLLSLQERGSPDGKCITYSIFIYHD